MAASRALRVATLLFLFGSGGIHNERPHEALNMECPAEVYAPSTRPLRRLSGSAHSGAALSVPRPDCYDRQLRPALTLSEENNLGKSLAGQAAGVKEVDSGIWLVSFMLYDLGYIDLTRGRFSRSTIPLRTPILARHPGIIRAQLPSG